MDKFSKEVEMPTCTLKTIRKFIEKTSDLPDDGEVTLEMLLMMTFPTVFENISKAMKDNYTAGYIQGVNDTKQ